MIRLQWSDRKENWRSLFTLYKSNRSHCHIELDRQFILFIMKGSNSIVLEFLLVLIEGRDRKSSRERVKPLSYEFGR